MILAQISDTHISLGTKRSLEAAAALQRAVSHLMQLPKRPDLVIVSGDCTDNGNVDEYDQFKALLAPLTMPVFVIPGNHDDRIHMQEAFGAQGSSPLPGFVQYAIDQHPVRVIALDTNVPGQPEGLLCDQRLRWLDERLAEAPQQPTLLVMHHPPFATGLRVVDDIGLQNADAFGAVVACHPQVERIVAGHVHWVMQRRFHGALAMTCSPTDHHLLPDFQRPEQLAVVAQAPSCYLHVWSSTTGLITYTSMIGDYEPPQLLHDGTGWVG